MKNVMDLRIGMFLLLMFASFNAHSVCIPFIGGWECDFKNEDTQLWGNQPGLYFAKEDRVDELIKQGESFIENYYSSVKTTGDAATRYMIAPTAAAMTIVEFQQALNTGLLLANDPWTLKPIYTDIICELYWEAQEAITGIERACPTTPELLTEFDKLIELDNIRQEILDIIQNPDLIIGEQWSNVIAEIESTRARLQSLDTFGRNIALPDMNAFFDERYPNLATLIAAPNETMDQFRTRVGELNTSRRNTIREHMMATHQNHLNLRNKDLPELEALSVMSERSVGRMQGTEIDNMLMMQGVQNAQTMAEEIMNMSTFYMQDMADEHGDATRRKAVATKSAEPIPFHEVVLGNGQVFTP